jgi:hypothetical protein
MLGYRAKHIACQGVILSLACGAFGARAAPPDLPLLPEPKKAQPPAKPESMPPVVATRVPVEFSVSVADIEKEMLRGIIQKIDPKAKPELPIVVKGNSRDLPANAPGKRAAKVAKDAPERDSKKPEQAQSNPKMMVFPAPVMPAPVQSGRPRLLARPPGSRIIERAVLRPAIEVLTERFMELPNLTYRIELRSFKLAISGQTLTCEVGGGFHAEGKVSPAQPGQPPLPPPSVRDITIKLTVMKELAWSESGKLELKEGTSQVWIDPDAPLVGFPRLDIARVIQLNGLLTLLNGVVDRQVMKQLVGGTLPDLAQIAPKASEKLPFLALAEITAYPLRSDGKDLYIPLIVGLVPSNKKTDDVVKIATKSGTPPEPKFRGKIHFNADGKPDVKLDPAKR